MRTALYNHNPRKIQNSKYQEPQDQIVNLVVLWDSEPEAQQNDCLELSFAKLLVRWFPSFNFI